MDLCILLIIDAAALMIATVILSYYVLKEITFFSKDEEDKS